MRRKSIVSMIIGVIIVISIIVYLNNTNTTENSTPTYNELEVVEFTGYYSQLFRTYTLEKDVIIVDGERVAKTFYFKLKPELMDMYNEIALWNDTQSAVVVIPIFTASAYLPDGFYDFYKGNCDTTCLTTKINFTEHLGYSASQNAVKILQLLGYPTITDIDIDKNPQILDDYDKVILLHNEYVTKKEFNAIINHPKVIYLYPNALYAEITADYDKNSITLIRGHGYPAVDIRNGFDWQYDNSEYEYDPCEKWKFYNITNGIMLNCYPEDIVYADELFLKTIKDL